MTRFGYGGSVIDMKTETYKGRKIKVRAGRKADWGKVFVTVNGVSWTENGHDEDKALASQRAWVDFIDQDQVVDGDRWAAYWYAPGTYRLCDESIHPVALDGECRHSTCVKKRDAA